MIILVYTYLLITFHFICIKYPVSISLLPSTRPNTIVSINNSSTIFTV